TRPRSPARRRGTPCSPTAAPPARRAPSSRPTWARPPTRRSPTGWPTSRTACWRRVSRTTTCARWPSSTPPGCSAWPRPARRRPALLEVEPMATIVAGIAASHSPQLSTPSELWRLHAERDRQNKQLHYRGVVYDYEQLAEARRGEHLEEQLDEATWLE